MEFELKYCQIVIILEGKKDNFDCVIPPPSMMNLRYFKTPDYIDLLLNIVFYNRDMIDKCEGCGENATLQCPTCKKLGLPASHFCNQVTLT